MTRRNILWAGVICVVLLIAASVQPLRIHALGRMSNWHAPLHILGFGLIALLFLALSRNRLQEYFILGALVGLGGVLEGAQTLLFHQRFEWKDSWADSVGVLMAFWVIRMIRKIYQ